jgi:tRNA threonylcarbamoyladenosine modification (KEOPS) complex  Pcc1 subunit
LQILQDSGKIEASSLDPNKAHMQVTFVEHWNLNRSDDHVQIPYFGMDGAVKKFVYLVPFTMSGRTHGDVASQYLRQVELTTAKEFPYLLKRIPVISVEETVLNPLQVSLRALRSRCARFKQLLRQSPTDMKSLQMVLSGSLRPQVNSGPAEIGRIFLKSDQTSLDLKYTDDEIEQLRSVFRTFLRLCEVGLTVNRQLISKGMKQYSAVHMHQSLIF